MPFVLCRVARELAATGRWVHHGGVSVTRLAGPFFALSLVACGSHRAASASGDAGTDGLGNDCSLNSQAQGLCPTLAGYGLFTGTGATQQPAADVVPYEVIVPLFADFAVKHRFLRVPAGEVITYDPIGRFALPQGAIVAKTFAFPRDARDPSQGERLVETRLLIQGPSGITHITYVWDAAQTRATRLVEGVTVRVDWIDETGAPRSNDFGVPNTNACLRCHGKTPTVLGVRTRQLNRDHDYGAGPENQLDHLARLGLLSTAPPPFAQRQRLAETTAAGAPLDERARSYLDANCGHCHDPSAAADWSGLYLDYDNVDTSRIGVCKPPSSAGDTGGRKYDVVPGDPSSSALVYRMQLGDSAYRMPEGSRLPDPTGIDVLSQWITAMTPITCP
jgi:uncharacterized repeat protein (TIGR03806 family)